MRKLIALSIGVLPLTSLAFYDSFDGNKLGSHWKEWSENDDIANYTVANSLLTVTRVYNSPTGYSSVFLHAAVEPYQDFDFRAVFGWDMGTNRSIVIGVGTYNDQFGFARLASFGFNGYPGGETSVSLAGADQIYLPEPAVGFHEFRATRNGSMGRAYLDGQLVASTENMTGWKVGGTGMKFGGPSDGIG